MRCALAVLALAALAACSRHDPSVARRLPDARLPTLAGPSGQSLAQCPTDKCLTVLVAPWCGVCHRAAPDIVRLRRYLDAAGVASRVVVGLSDAGPIREFAAEFGADTLLDAGGVLTARGVPLFLTSDRTGKVIGVVNGFPMADSPAELARSLGLL